MMTKNATQYIPTMNSFTDKHWKNIATTVSTYLAGARKAGSKRSKAMVSCQPEDTVESINNEPEYVLQSDKSDEDKDGGECP